MATKLTRIHVLYNTAENNETRIEAITSSDEVRMKWDRHWGNHSEPFILDELSTIQWALRDDDNDKDGK